MATELPHRYTLVASLFIGTRDDLLKGMLQLRDVFPENIEADPEGWKLVNVNPDFVEKLKAVFIEDKIKFSERFEQHVIMYLGWVMGRRFTTLHLSCNEPAHNVEVTTWKWTPIKEAANGKDDSDNS